MTQNLKQSILKIPKKIKLLGIDWDVSYIDNLAQANNHVAEIKYQVNKIHLQRNVKGFPVNDVQNDINFLHEIVHLVLTEMGRDELSNDEEFVDMFARFLYAIQKENKIFK